MIDADLKTENAALRKQNKDLKALLEEALEIIRKLKELVDQPAKPSAKTGVKSKPKTASKKSASVTKRSGASRKAS